MRPLLLAPSPCIPQDKYGKYEDKYAKEYKPEYKEEKYYGKEVRCRQAIRGAVGRGMHTQVFAAVGRCTSLVANTVSACQT